MRSINVNTFKKAIFGRKKESPSETAMKINEAPAVRALEPARWLINSDGYYPYCSRCGREPEDGNMTSTCPHCRANMRW